jgi:hypothetical protein
MHYQQIDPSVRIVGELLTDAEFRMTSGSNPCGLLMLTILQLGSIPIKAAHLVGSEPANLIAAKAKARVLRRGDAVTVTGCKIVAHPGDRCLELMGVRDVMPSKLGVSRLATGDGA